MNEAQSLRVGIIGGGPGGLALASILHARGITATLFEGDSSSAHRAQGGSLDMHTASGLRAIELAGLLAPFQAVARYEDQGMRLADKNGTLLRTMDNDEDGGRLRSIADSSAISS